jgi:quercetin dioxygenase-like cupin family protein
MLAAQGTDVGAVFFEPGARTYWHSHSDGQLLLTTQGRGIVATRNGDVVELSGSDIAHAPGGEEHWHGAMPDSYLLHTSITLGSSTWLEEVSETEYRSAVAHLAGQQRGGDSA